MAFDGITTACLRKELSSLLVGGRITKIVQSEADELLLTIKNNAAQYRLLLSASASLPLVYLTEQNKAAPMTMPNTMISGRRPHRLRDPAFSGADSAL